MADVLRELKKGDKVIGRQIKPVLNAGSANEPVTEKKTRKSKKTEVQP